MIITLQNRGTITVSRELRKKMGVAPGDHLEAKVENGILTIDLKYKNIQLKSSHKIEIK